MEQDSGYAEKEDGVAGITHLHSTRLTQLLGIVEYQ